MLYVFHVDQGIMMTFDMDFINTNVFKLKEEISRTINIPIDKAELMISGGEVLQNKVEVRYYSAGTDTNPIFFFNVLAIENNQHEQEFVEDISLKTTYSDLKNRVDDSLRAGSSQNVINTRAKLSQQIYDASRILLASCEQSVQDQHSQYQGWMAVAASSEDILKNITKSFEMFTKDYSAFLESRNSNIQLLEKFHEDIALLKKVPILHSIYSQTGLPKSHYPSDSENCSYNSSDSKSISSRQSMSSASSDKKMEEHNLEIKNVPKSSKKTDDRTLYDHFSAESIQSLLNACREKFSTFNHALLSHLQTKYANIPKERRKVTEIRGISERLSILHDKLRYGQKCLDGQKKIAETIYQEKCGVPSVGNETLKNMCQYHLGLLNNMIYNYKEISSVYENCQLAKFELSTQIFPRLHWTYKVNNRFTGLDADLFLYKAQLRRLDKEIKLVVQLHRAPHFYFNAVSEVVRRRRFSKLYTHWTSGLSEESGEIQKSEVLKRERFSSEISKNFVVGDLFPGLNDFPPAFATDKPKNFDMSLPDINEEQIEILKNRVPELSHLLTFKDTYSEAVPSMIKKEFFDEEHSSREYLQGEGSNSKELRDQDVGDFGDEFSDRKKNLFSIEKRKLQSPLTKELIDSETDTDDFEKVCSSDGFFSLSEYPSSQNVPCQPTRPWSSTFVSPESKYIKLDHEKDKFSLDDSPKKSRPKFELGGKSLTIDPNCRSKSKKSVNKVQAAMQYSNSTLVQSSALQSEVTDENVSMYCPNELSMEQQGWSNEDGARTNSIPCDKSANLSDKFDKKFDSLSKNNEMKFKSEKDNRIFCLESQLNDSRVEVEELRAKFKKISDFGFEEVKKLKEELKLVRDETKNNCDSYTICLSEFSNNILPRINSETEDRKAAIENLNIAQNRDEERFIALQAQLSDAHKELDIYQGHIRAHLTTIEHLHCDLEQQNSSLTFEKNEAIKKLTLEHELEMEALKSDCDKMDQIKSDEISDLKKKVSDFEKDLKLLETERNALKIEFNNKLLEKVKEKEDSIFGILESGFSEREKRSLDNLRNELQISFDKRILEIEEENKDRTKKELESLRNELKSDHENSLKVCLLDIERIHNEELQKCRQLWEMEKEEQIETTRQEEKSEYEQKLETLRLKHKMDVEGLRCRYRMMTAANMECKSPSETSLEKFERGDFVETSYHDRVITNIRQDLESEKEEALSELQKTMEEKLNEAQVNFAEKSKLEIVNIRKEKDSEFELKIKEISDYKNGIIEELKRNVDSLTADIERMKNCDKPDAQSDVIQELEMKCSRYQTEISRLQSDLEQTRKLSFICESPSDMSSSIDLVRPPVGSPSQTEAASSPGPEVSTSQTVDSGYGLPTSESSENLAVQLQFLRNQNSQLKNSMDKVWRRRMVCLDDALLHDLVLVVWDDVYSQYRILLDGSQPFIHFLHCDSYEPLGLVKGESRPQKLYCIATVTKKKEFCQAKRDGNRFRVPKGTKFYRVQAGPLFSCNIDSAPPGTLRLCESSPAASPSSSNQ